MSMRTTQVARSAGVNAQTLRYYERRGLLPDPPRTSSGYRTYGPETVRIVRFVKQVQELGFSLDQAEDLLHLADGGPDRCDEVQRMTGDKLAEVDAKIEALMAMRESLGRLLATCSQPRANRDCPLLQGLADEERP